MADYQRIVEFLRDFRASPVQQVTDELRQYAAEYAELCQKANERLRQCSRFLQQGLRSEAIHLADEAPNLLDLVAALDLPDPQGWVEFCQQNELPTPPALMIDRATQLNEAYGQDEQLDDLLPRHRRLALARAPVKERLEVMRKIAGLDVNSAFWDKDIRTFEQARMAELRLSFATALRGSDQKAVAVLTAEILQTPWLEPLPQDLLAAAEKAKEKIQIAQVSQALGHLMDRLRTAYAARSHGECSALLGKCKELVGEWNGAVVTPQIASEIKMIVAWVSQETELNNRRQAFEDACRGLSDALDADAPDAELEGRFQKLKDMQEPIPQELEQRYNERLVRRERAVQRKHRLLLAAVAALVLVALGVALLVSQYRLAGNWAAKIRDANSRKDLTLARQFIAEQEKLAPKLNKAPELVTAKRETDNLQKQLEQDTETFRKLLTTAQAELKSAQDAAAKEDAGVDETLVAARIAAQAVERFQKRPNLAWVDPDNKMSVVVGDLQAVASQLADKAAVAIQRQVDALGQKVDGIPGDPAATDVREQIAGLDEAGNGIAALRGYANVRASIKDSLDAIAQKVEQKRSALSSALTFADDLKALSQQAKSAAEWKRALEAFTQKYPNVAVSKEFSAALPLLDACASMEAWSELTQRWGSRLEATSEGFAKQRAQDIDAYLEANSHSPYRSTAQSYQSYLKQAAEGLAQKSAWLEDFKELLASPLMTDIKCIEDSKGTRYYLLGDFKPHKQQMNDQIKWTFEAMDPKDITQTRSVTIAPPLTLKSDKPTPLPHVKAVEVLSLKLRQANPATWETFGIDVVDDLVKNQEMDLVVKAILLRQAMETTRKVSNWAIGGMYDRPWQELVRLEVENLKWYDTDRPISEVTLGAVRKTIESIPAADDVRARAGQYKASLAKSVPTKILGCGTLMREGPDWTIRTPGAFVDGTICVTAGPLAANAAPTAAAPLLRVAEYRGGKVVVNEAQVKNLPQGTLVYMLRGQ